MHSWLEVDIVILDAKQTLALAVLVPELILTGDDSMKRCLASNQYGCGYLVSIQREELSTKVVNAFWNKIHPAVSINSLIRYCYTGDMKVWHSALWECLGLVMRLDNYGFPGLDQSVLNCTDFNFNIDSLARTIIFIEVLPSYGSSKKLRDFYTPETFSTK